MKIINQAILQMKKTLLCSALFCALGALQSNAQENIPNGSFENWGSSDTFETIDISPAPLFESSNREYIYRNGDVTLTKVEGAEGFGMRLENKLSEGDTAKGFASWGSAGDNGFSKGIPVNGNGLTGLSISLKYDIDTSTPGFIAIIPTTNGQPSGLGNGLFPGGYIYQISGSQSTFMDTTFTFAPSLLQTADSVVIFISSADMINSENGTPGDFIELDNIAFIGSTTNFPNGDLEKWIESEPIELPDVWYTEYYDPENVPFEKVFNSNDLSTALRLVNIQYNDDDNNVGIARASIGYWDCSNGGNCNQVPGMSVHQTPNAISFDYKYTSPGPDTATLNVSIIGEGNTIAGTWNELLPNNEWETVKFNIYPYGGTGASGDSAFIAFESGKWEQQIAGSELLLDNVKFHFCDEQANINGPTNVCVNTDSANYVIDSDFGESFAWTTTTGNIVVNNDNLITIDDITAPGVAEVIVSYSDGCPNKTFSINIDTSSASSVYISGPDFVCANDSEIMLEAFLTGATSADWTNNGSGVLFESGNKVFYYPSIDDIINGVVNIITTPTGTGSCTPIANEINIAITPQPNVNAGPDAYVCESSTVSLIGLSTTNDGIWLDNNAGVFSSNGLNTEFIPSQQDLDNGFSTLLLMSKNNGVCTAVYDTLMIYWEKEATVDAGIDQTACNGEPVTLTGTAANAQSIVWTTAGFGNFTDGVTLNTSYNPLFEDNQIVILTLTATGSNVCPDVTDDVTITYEVCTSTSNKLESIASIFPNPTTGTVSIKTGNTSGNIIVSDLSGKEVYTSSIHPNNNTVDLNNLESGIYQITITDGKSTHSEKLFINK